MSVDGIGDINDDGFEDLIVGAPSADFNGESSGTGYVIFGQATVYLPNLIASDLDGALGFNIHGEGIGHSLGFSASGAGDVNGDGIDDFIVGAPRATPNGTDSGMSYVTFGRTTRFWRGAESCDA